jgi:hypothetical protein
MISKRTRKGTEKKFSDGGNMSKQAKIRQALKKVRE